MKKFPVTSKEGNEYLVKFEKLIHRIGWKCYLYEVLKIKKVKVFSFLVNTSYYDESWDSNFIDMSQCAISDYEVLLEEKNRQKILEKDNKQKFKDWDGKC